ncbi:glycoside hydrolase family 18 protein [Hamadaea tsunoensis]|uniref:hypothetical protein n=1 Tax=Hamadaea tsunoensis TaxID=53368 RepID=UPI0012F77228|nr:hypothetical protein [Hamadaea tsunoensis]
MDRTRRWVRRAARAALALCAALVLAAGSLIVALDFEAAGDLTASGNPAASGDPAAPGSPGPARSTGDDAEWLGHAWVDGRRTQSDVDALAAALRPTGIHDLFVHAGPFSDDGTLDPALRPRARWLVDALHTALPGVRVQAWLGAHPTDDELHLGDPATQANILAADAQVLDDGFDGIHYDFEPVNDGDPRLTAVLARTHALTRSRGALLSVSAVHTEAWSWMSSVTPLLWSRAYLHAVAVEVDQVAVMSYDTMLPSETAYAGYVRRSTEIALAAVPPGVTLFMGVPAYHDERPTHHRAAETVTAAVRGVRLALGGTPRDRRVGLALYVDFAATSADWSAYSAWVS